MAGREGGQTLRFVPPVNQLRFYSPSRGRIAQPRAGNHMHDFVILLLIAAVLLPVWALCSVKFLKRNERAIVLRLGGPITNFFQPLGGGFHWVWWPVDKLYRWKIFTGEEQLLGAEGEMLDVLNERSGLVRIGGEMWMASTSESIPCRQNVRVVGFEGENLRVTVGSQPKSKEALAEERTEGLQKDIENIQESMKSSPDNADSHWDLATLYEAKGDSQAAFMEYQTAERLNPNIRAEREKLMAGIKASASRKV